MSEKVRTTCRLEADTDAELKRAATSLNQPQERVIEDAIKHYCRVVVPRLIEQRQDLGLLSVAEVDSPVGYGARRAPKKKTKKGVRKK